MFSTLRLHIALCIKKGKVEQRNVTKLNEENGHRKQSRVCFCTLKNHSFKLFNVTNMLCSNSLNFWLNWFFDAVSELM